MYHVYRIESIYECETASEFIESIEIDNYQFIEGEYRDEEDCIFTKDIDLFEKYMKWIEEHLPHEDGLPDLPKEFIDFEYDYDLAEQGLSGYVVYDYELTVDELLEYIVTNSIEKKPKYKVYYLSNDKFKDITNMLAFA